jgi:hypothetical protein
MIVGVSDLKFPLVFTQGLCKFVNFFCLRCGENKVNMMDLVPLVRMKMLKCLQKQDGSYMFGLLGAPFSNVELELLWAALIPHTFDLFLVLMVGMISIINIWLTKLGRQ